MRDEGYAMEDSYGVEGRPLRRDGSKGLAHRQERVEKEIARLDEALDHLGVSLAPILGPERPSPTLAGDGSTDDPGSDLSRFLEGTAGRLAMLNSRLRYLIERVDL